MAGDRIERDAGRLLFGDDPGAYDKGRPEYPERVYELLSERFAVGPGTRVLEIGAGSGLATRRLEKLGAASIVAVEPDARLAAYLGDRVSGAAVKVIAKPFEAVQLAPASFDLAISATAFHWLEQASALRKVADLLRPGGGWEIPIIRTPSWWLRRRCSRACFWVPRTHEAGACPSRWTCRRGSTTSLPWASSSSRRAS
jgi:SAM-dependent methyltransferase